MLCSFEHKYILGKLVVSGGISSQTPLFHIAVYTLYILYLGLLETYSSASSESSVNEKGPVQYKALFN